MNGDPVDDKDFDFEITDDNTLFACEMIWCPMGRSCTRLGREDKSRRD